METAAIGIILEDQNGRMTVHGEGPSKSFIENYFLHYLGQPHQASVVPPNQPTREIPPLVGEQWPEQGGIYTGEVRGEDGAPNYHLILLDQPEHAAMPWLKATDWAAGLKVHGFDDWSLPTRREQRLLFVNAKTHFKDERYWSSEQHAGTSSHAWVQFFSDGFQLLNWKADEYRVLAVRRVVIR